MRKKKIKRRIVNWQEVVQEVKGHGVFELGMLSGLKRRGQFYVASCPFHQERTPSFIIFGVSGWRQSSGWHCFGCGSQGTIIDFYMDYRIVPFGQAVIELAKFFKIKFEWRNVP